MTIVWVIGAVVTVLVYLAGPEHFFYWLFAMIEDASFALRQAIANLSASAFNLLRAAAVGLFVVFVALSLMVIHAGGRGRGALLVIGGLFLLLVAKDRYYDVGNARWVAALILAGIGAGIMTRRLRGGPR